MHYHAGAWERGNERPTSNVQRPILNKEKKGQADYYFLWSLLGSGAVLKRKAYGLAVGFLQHENLD
jgi:hypothetical protein